MGRHFIVNVQQGVKDERIEMTVERLAGKPLPTNGQNGGPFGWTG
jgi:hypothetical protein